jgi:hypothetical protein
MLSRLSVAKYRLFEAFIMQILLKFSLQSILDISKCNVYLQLNEMSPKKILTSIVSAMQLKTTVIQAYEKLGHCSEDLTRKIGKSLGWDITKGSFNVCEACTIAKAQQKNVPKGNEHVVAGKPNESIFLDLSMIKHLIEGPKVIRLY